jgi:hypothetical protein
VLFEFLGGGVCGYYPGDTFPDFPQILQATEPKREDHRRLTEQVDLSIQIPFLRYLVQFSTEILAALIDMFDCFLSFL